MKDLLEGLGFGCFFGGVYFLLTGDWRSLFICAALLIVIIVILTYFSKH